MKVHELQELHLQRLNAFNTLFQCYTIITSPRRGKKLSKEALCDFIRPETVRREDPFTLDIHSANNRVDISHDYLGVAAPATF